MIRVGLDRQIRGVKTTIGQPDFSTDAVHKSLNGHKMLGHFSRSPSNQRIYNSSAIGDLRVGEAGSVRSSLEGVGDDDDGKLEISSSSVTIRPLAVISLFRMTRLCGKRPRAV